jgi:hypothetical protein
MSETFDPYHEWLGIRPEEHPVDYYRLLGIAALEDNVTAIENAADRQMGHLRKFQTGKHSALSQKLLNEVAAARVCLLTPAKKAAYDAKLRQKMRAVAPAAGAAPSSSEPDLAGFVESLSKEKPAQKKPATKVPGPVPRKRKGPPLIGIAASVLAAVLLVLGIGVFMRQNAPSPIAKPGPALKPDHSPKPEPAPRSDHRANQVGSPHPDRSPTPDPVVKRDLDPKPKSGPKPAPGPTPAEVKIVVDCNREDKATPEFRFDRVPSPQPAAAVKAKFTALGGVSEKGGLQHLNDGGLPEKPDDRGHNFHFANGRGGGRLLVDLQHETRIKQVNTYSWHVDGRGPQVYKLFASDGSAAGFDAAPKAGTDPAKAGWTRLAAVDTRPQAGDFGGQYGVSISRPNGEIGTFRFLLFDIAATERDDQFGNTFYSRIDVIDADHNGPPRPPAIKPPSQEEQRPLIDQINKEYGVDKANDAAAKLALASKLLDAGRAAEGDGKKFMLLRRAGELAADAGNADLACEAVDAILEAGFVIKPFPNKGILLKRLFERAAQNGECQPAAMADIAIRFAQAAVADDDDDDAEAVLKEARLTLAAAMRNAQQALRKAKQSRARDSDEKTAQQDKIAVAEEQLKAAQSAQAELENYVKEFPQERRGHDDFHAAQDRLKAQPDDSEASLVAGRWYCFRLNDWEAGLKLLAKGSDPSLKAAAAAELSAQPSQAKELIAGGDAWWNLAEKSASVDRTTIRRHAAELYQKGVASVAGLEKTKVEMRIEQAKAGDRPLRRQAGEEAAWTDWKDLFDGKTLNGWKQLTKGAYRRKKVGTVTVEAGRLILGDDSLNVGITATDRVPKSNYEIEVGAMRVSGNGLSSFCFPVGDAYCRLAVGGYETGDIVGLQLVDGKDAQSNETTRHVRFQSNRWYTVRLRVTDDRVQVWIDGNQAIDLPRRGHDFTAGKGREEITGAGSLGIYTNSGAAAIRSIRIRQLKPDAKAESTK